MNNILFLDVETTGFKDPRLVQLAYVTNKIKFESLYFPERLIDPGAMEVHGITDENVLNKGLFQESVDQKILQLLLEESVLVAHNAKFDVKIIGIEGVVPKKVICTYRCAQTLLAPTGYDGRHRLQVLREYFKLEFDEDIKAHDAMGDVIVLKALFKKLLELAHGDTLEEKVQHMIELSQ